MAIHCYGLPTLELALNQNSMGFQIKGIFWGSLQKGLQSVVKYIYIYIDAGCLYMEITLLYFVALNRVSRWC